MTSEDVIEHIRNTSSTATNEFKRLFHGRGGLYEDWKHLTIDSIDDILSVALYFQETNESRLLDALLTFANYSRYKTLVIQRRYLKDSPTELLLGTLNDDLHIVENGMKIKLNLLSNQNSGYFADMKKGREFVRENAKDKKVLNLFSYTCGFSLAAKFGEAYSVTNVDMNKSALKAGEINHILNNLDTVGVSYLSYNILKSFSSLKRKGPFDLIIIDPPTFQKGSFEATKDYEKIIKKLPELASEHCILLSCLNSPNLDSKFILDLMQKWAPNFQFMRQLDNVQEYASLDESRSLKNLIFHNEATQ